LILKTFETFRGHYCRWNGFTTKNNKFKSLRHKNQTKIKFNDTKIGGFSCPFNTAQGTKVEAMGTRTDARRHRITQLNRVLQKPYKSIFDADGRRVLYLVVCQLFKRSSDLTRVFFFFPKKFQKRRQPRANIDSYLNIMAAANAPSDTRCGSNTSQSSRGNQGSYPCLNSLCKQHGNKCFYNSRLPWQEMAAVRF